MTEAGEALEMARKDLEGKGASAMVAAVALRAKLSGLLVEKSAVQHHGPLHDAATDVLLAMRRQLELRIAQQ